MKLKKIITSVVSIAFLSLSMVTPVVANQEVITPVKEIKPIEKLKPHFMSFTGVVKEINDFHADKTAKFLNVEGENSPCHLIIAEDTYIVDNAEISVGSEIIFFYDASLPMILIYPPQIKADVVALKDDITYIKTDIFDKNYVSLDGELRLTSISNSEIIKQDNTPFTGDIANHKLIVIYDFIKESFPAQTSPKKIIVLDDVTTNDEDLYDENYTPDVSKMNVVVDNNIVISTPKAYINDEGVVMVPLRVIAEALDYEVKWIYDEFNQLGKIYLNGDTIRLTVGEKIYVYNVPIPLDTAPAIVDNTTYVPLNFFTDVLLLNNAYVFEGQIDINNGEKME